MRNLKRELKELKEEFEEKSELFYLSYDRLADGGRAQRCNKKIDPEQEAAIRKLFNL